MDSAVTSQDEIAQLRAAYDTCFGCGTANPVGLGISDFSAIPAGATAPFFASTDHNGFHGIVHGGVIATALDEISAWACVLSEGVFVVTATLEIRYRKEVRTQTDYTLSGQVVHRAGKRLRVEATLHSDTTTVAQSSGLFFVAETVENMLASEPDH